MSLATPLRVQKLQTALHDKAKGSPSFRFYALYDPFENGRGEWI
jgi:RNA-directed DNA polymerase